MSANPSGSISMTLVFNYLICSDVFFSTLVKIYYDDRILHVNDHPVVGSTSSKEQACSTDIGKIVYSRN